MNPRELLGLFYRLVVPGQSFKCGGIRLWTLDAGQGGSCGVPCAGCLLPDDLCEAACLWTLLVDAGSPDVRLWLAHSVEVGNARRDKSL